LRASFARASRVRYFAISPGASNPGSGLSGQTEGLLYTDEPTHPVEHAMTTPRQYNQGKRILRQRR
jgi:hypothetical protein